jgi:hypothetical protein
MRKCRLLFLTSLVGPLIDFLDLINHDVRSPFSHFLKHTICVGNFKAKEADRKILPKNQQNISQNPALATSTALCGVTGYGWNLSVLPVL